MVHRLHFNPSGVRCLPDVDVPFKRQFKCLNISRRIIRNSSFDFGYIQYIATGENFKRRGLGSRLCNHLMDVRRFFVSRVTVHFRNSIILGRWDCFFSLLFGKFKHEVVFNGFLGNGVRQMALRYPHFLYQRIVFGQL